MKDWKKSSVAIGSSTDIPAILTSFIPVIQLCITYNCWSPINTVLAAWDMVAVPSGAFYFVGPASYYAASDMTRTYLGFLSGGIGNTRAPCAALTPDVTHSASGAVQAEVVSAMAICGSIITNLIGTTSAIIVGGAVLSVLPGFIAVGLTKYASSAIFGATLGDLTVKYPKIVVFALAAPVILKMITGLPVAAVIVCTAFGTLFIARVFHKKGFVK